MRKLFVTILILLLSFVPLVSVEAATDIINDGTLSTSLEACWEMNESSGARVDSQASFNLTDNNTVTQDASGIQDEAAQFERDNSEYLSLADDATFDVTTSVDRSIQVWVKTTNVTGFPSIAGKWKTSATQARNWLFRVETDGTPRFFVGDGGSSTRENVQATSTVDDGSWHQVVVTFDSSTDTARIYVDGQTAEGTTASMTPAASTAGLGIGAESESGDAGSAAFWDGSIDVVAWWSKVLSESEIDSLYNGGSGIPCEGASVRRIIISREYKNYPDRI